MRCIIIIFLVIIPRISHSQWGCYHIDCGCFSKPDSITQNLKLDTTYYFSIISDPNDISIPIYNNPDYKWQENYLVKIYSLNNITYQIDTLFLSSGFILNGKKNDAWEYYSYKWYDINDPCIGIIYVKEGFYFNDVELISLCGNVFFKEGSLNIDSENNTASFVCQFDLSLLDCSIDTIVDLNINCSDNSLGNFHCVGATNDSTPIFDVDAKYIADELEIMAASKLTRKLTLNLRNDND